jgi:20S proteasome alpha/beta subunit
MTCIVAQKTKTGIVIGAESGATEGVIVHRKADPKIWKVHETIAIGFSGSLRHANVFQEFKFENLVQAVQYDTPSNRLAQIIGQELRPIVDPHTTDKRYGYCLIAVGKELFRVDSETGVFRLDCSYTALGAGEEVAIGALYVLNRNEPELPDVEMAKARIVIALDATCEHVGNHRPPFVVLETKV